MKDGTLLDKGKGICALEKTSKFMLWGLDGIYISAWKADIADRSAQVSLSTSSSSEPWIRRIDDHRASFTLSILGRKSSSGLQQLSWLNWGGVTKAPVLWAEKPCSTFNMYLMSLRISGDKREVTYHKQNHSIKSFWWMLSIKRCQWIKDRTFSVT